MSIFQKHLNDARRRLMWPTRASLDDGVLSPYTIEAIDELVTKRQNTHEPSLIAFGTLITEIGVTAYPLDNIAPNYGKARYLYTKNETGDANFQRRWVELVSLEMLTEQYRGGDAVGVVPSSNCPAIPLAASVYYDANRGNMIEVAPVPQQSIIFDFVYEPATLRPQSKQDRGFTLEQFDGYVAALAALRALPHCQWRGLSRAEAKDRREEIRETLIRDIGSENERRGYAYLYWQFNLTSVNKTNDTTIGFGKGVWW